MESVIRKIFKQLLTSVELRMSPSFRARTENKMIHMNIWFISGPQTICIPKDDSSPNREIFQFDDVNCILNLLIGA